MPGSIMDLARTLGLGFAQPNRTGRNNNGTGGNPGFALTGHSSSLVARFVSAINPRAVVFSPGDGREPDYVALGFARGEQFAEIAARDPATGVLRFFLFAFEQACNATRSCTAGDLLTPAVEKGFTKVTVYEDIDIKNTVFDCTQCHQPGGPSSAKLLRMQELRNPWTHFFRDNTPGGQALIADYLAAHGNAEDYGPIPGALVSSSEPAKLEDFVRGAGFSAQPNEFPTGRIEDEVENSAPLQPRDNSAPGTSATWQTLFDGSMAGRFIVPPYHDVKVTDPGKLAQATSAYASFRAGTLPAAQLPDFRGDGIILQSRAWAMGFAAKPGLDGKGILVQACQQCHNPSLDQTISRAKFDVTKLATMDRAAKDKAIERLKLKGSDRLSMPPARFRTLTPAEIDLAVAELKK
jgi:mono/diheme cytochrome c family protein